MCKKISETAILLFKKLKTFNNNKDFVLGVMSNAPHYEDMKKIIEYMDNGQHVTIEN